MIHFKFGLSKSFTNTITQAVGPTTVNGARTLPQPAVGDGTCFFVAPNGSDGATGNEGDPFLTIAFGIAALTGPRNTLHIERNGYVGDMEFTESASIALGTSENLQVSLGETAKFTMTGSPRSVTIAGGEINGIEIESANSSGQAAILGYGTVENCIVNSVEGDSAVLMSSTLGNMTINYSLLMADINALRTSTTSTGTVTIANCVLMSRNEGLTTNDAVVELSAPASGTPQTHTISRCVFMNHDGAFQINDLGRGDTVVIESNAFVDIGTGFFGTGGSAIVNLDFNYMPVSPLRDAAFAPATFTNTNELDSTVPPLFVDQQGAFDTVTADGFRLQLAGKSTPDGTGRYFIDSPLLDAGVSGVDAAPWDETLTGPVFAYASEFDLQYQPGSITTEHMPQQVQSGVDLRGNLHEVTEGNKRAWSLSWGSYQNNRDRINLVQLLADPGSVQFHLLGDGVTNFTHTSLGSFDSTTGILSPTGLPSLLIPGNWAGFWCVIGSDDFYIVSNTTTTLTLVDKIGSGFPASGSVNFSVPYILVRAEKVPLTVNQENGTEFTRGGAIAELEIRETAAFEPNGGQIRFREIEDPDDGVF